MNKGQQITALGAVGMIVGTLLPWGQITSVFGSVTRAGYEGDGIITGGIGILLLIIALVHKGKSGHMYFVIGPILALVAGGIASQVWMNVMSIITETGTVSVGSGLYLTLIGALLATVGGLQRLPTEQIKEEV